MPNADAETSKWVRAMMAPTDDVTSPILRGNQHRHVAAHRMSGIHEGLHLFDGRPNDPLNRLPVAPEAAYLAMSRILSIFFGAGSLVKCHTNWRFFRYNPRSFGDMEQAPACRGSLSYGRTSKRSACDGQKTSQCLRWRHMPATASCTTGRVFSLAGETIAVGQTMEQILHLVPRFLSTSVVAIKYHSLRLLFVAVYAVSHKGEASLTVSPKIRFIDEKNPSAAHCISY